MSMKGVGIIKSNGEGTGRFRERKSKLGGAADAPRQTVKLRYYAGSAIPVAGHRPCLAAPISAWPSDGI